MESTAEDGTGSGHAARMILLAAEGRSNTAIAGQRRTGSIPWASGGGVILSPAWMD